MRICLKDLLKCKIFSDSIVCAGEKGLTNYIDSVTIWESPVASKYIKGQELVITSGYCLLNNIDLQKSIIEDLVHSGASGLAIALMFYNYELPAIMKETADQYDFPIISIPDDIYYVDIYELVTSNYFSDLTKDVKKIEEVYKEIDESIFREGLEGAAKSLHIWTGLSTAVVFGKQIFLKGIDRDQYELPTNPKDWKVKTDAKVVKPAVTNFYYRTGLNSKEWLGAKIDSSNRVEAYIQLIKGERDFSEEDFTLLEHAAIACASETKRLSESIDIQRKYHGEFFEKLFEGNYTYEEAKHQSYILGFNLPEDGIVIIVDLLPLVTEKIIDSDSNELFDNKICSLLARIFGKNALFYIYRSKEIFVFSPYDPEENIQRIQDLHDALDVEFGEGSADIGISKVLKYHALKRGINEARNAIQIGSHLKIKPNIYHFNELGFYRLLNLPDAMSDINNYYVEYIEPLINYDSINGADLLETLICYIDNNYKYIETAASMYIHPNTARYRISLVEKVCNVDFKQPHDRFNMELAIKILPLINTSYSNR